MKEVTTLKLEYVWIGLNGFQGETWTLRSKLKVHQLTTEDVALLAKGDVSSLPTWSFDGSSTGQATGDNSDCILLPVRAVTDTVRNDGKSVIVLCEVLNPDGTPHVTNHRHVLVENEIANMSLEAGFGLEQEYSITKNGRPLGFPDGGYPYPQGPYYCSAGADRCFGREISEELVDACINAGIHITGTNVEVKPGQHEYQVGGPNVGPTLVSDEIWLSRWILLKIAEKHGLAVTFEAKPVMGDWNGAGLHHNVSTKELRENGTEEKFKAIMDRLALNHKEDMKVYGADNHLRMTGNLETSSKDEFSWGVSDRGCSVRIPIQTIQKNWCGYFEDRRPASSIDPYQTTNAILKSLITTNK
jgi:glutamine synthetase